jgi:hypothetical protein
MVTGFVRQQQRTRLESDQAVAHQAAVKPNMTLSRFTPRHAIQRANVPGHVILDFGKRTLESIQHGRHVSPPLPIVQRPESAPFQAWRVIEHRMTPVLDNRTSQCRVIP